MRIDGSFRIYLNHSNYEPMVCFYDKDEKYTWEQIPIHKFLRMFDLPQDTIFDVETDYQFEFTFWRPD